MMKLDLDEIINYCMVCPEMLAHKSKNAKLVEGENTSSVDFRSETFEFGNELFLARFIYYHNILKIPYENSRLLVAEMKVRFFYNQKIGCKNGL